MCRAWHVVPIEIGVGRRLRLAVVDPNGLPIVGLQQGHLPSGRRTPRRNMALAVPNADLPMATHTAGHRLSSVLHLDRGIRRHPTAIPQITLVLAEQFARARHEYLIGRLGLAAGGRFGRLEHPTEPRLRGVDAQRIDHGLTPQMGWRDARWWLGGLRQCNKGRDDRKYSNSKPLWSNHGVSPFPAVYPIVDTHAAAPVVWANRENLSMAHATTRQETPHGKGLWGRSAAVGCQILLNGTR
jgi:hypothetical protein